MRQTKKDNMTRQEIIESAETENKAAKEETEAVVDAPLKKKSTKKIVLNKKQIDAWKKEFGPIYRSITADGDVIIWRPMNRDEYINILDAYDNSDLSEEKTYLLKQEETVRQMTLYPQGDDLENIIKTRGGFASALSRDILSRSGFDLTTPEEL